MMNDESPDIPEELQAWAKFEDIIGQPCDDSADILEEVKHWIDAEHVQIEEESDKYYQLLGIK